MALTPEALIRARHGIWTDRLEILKGRIAAGDDNPGPTPIEDELPCVIARIEEIEDLADELGIVLVRPRPPEEAA